MKIRDGFATMNGNKATYEFKDGVLDIVSSEGNTILTIRQQGLEFEIHTSSTGKHGGVIFDSTFSIRPVATNMIRLTVDEYKD